MIKFILISLGVLVAVIVIGGTIFMTYGMGRTKNAIISDVNLSRVPDGVYKGSYSGGRWSNQIEVTVSGGKIVTVVTSKPMLISMEEIAQKVYSAVVEKQSLQVDTVSSATVTTKAVLKAIENALKR